MATRNHGSADAGVGCGRGRIEISEFAPRQSFSFIESPVCIRGSWAVVTTLLHLGLLAVVAWSNNRVTAHPNLVEGARAAHEQTSGEGELFWFVDEGGGGPQHPGAVLAALTPSQLEPIVVAAPPLPLAMNSSDIAERDGRADAGNESDSSAKVFGAYLGQVNARIDRAWIRPTAPIGAGIFLCHVLIDQDARGNVLEVSLDGCNGTPVWQRSLVNAVMSASPLPSPSDPAVFAPRVQLRFHETAPDEEFTATPVPSDAGVNSATDPGPKAGLLAAFRRIRHTGTHSVGSSSTDLRMEGSADGRQHNLEHRDRSPLMN